MNDEAKENKFSDEMAALIRNVELELVDIAKEYNIPGIQLIRDAGCILRKGGLGQWQTLIKRE